MEVRDADWLHDWPFSSGDGMEGFRHVAHVGLRDVLRRYEAKLT